VGLAIAGLLAAFTLRPSVNNYPTVATRTAPSTPGRLTVRLLGTSTLAFDDGKDVVLIDGYLSRPGALPLLTQPLHPDQDAIARHLKRADIQRISAIYVAHTHFDHALDSASMAKAYGAALNGTDTLAAIAAAEGFEGPVHRLKSSQPTKVGAFQVTPFSTPHSPGDIAAGATAAAFRFPARARAYPEGGAHSFLIEHGTCRILVVPSAGHPGDSFRGVRADVVMLGVGNLSRQGPDAIAAYWRDTVGAVGARLVIPIHWDDFSRSLDRPLAPFPYALDRFDQTMKQLDALAGDQIELRLPRAFDAMDWSDLPAGGCA
jgi:L-ascorbate metabolism protein UlaG (beta-lactamase superfamily)